jgi:NTP pyrophosphatase (non-canonical NTP hydrolase)
MTKRVHKHVDVSPAARECCAHAILAWGEKAQMLMMMEEMGELTVELSHYLRGRNNYTNVTEEVADVLFMALQMREMFGAEAVDEQLHLKLIRLRKRLTRAGETLTTAEELP